MSDIVEKLRSFAARESEMSRSMAEAKSLRQADNPSGECVYSWLKPEETLSGQAVETILALRKEAEALREHIAEQVTHVETRIQDGIELGATVWRIALEDVARESRAALATEANDHSVGTSRSSVKRSHRAEGRNFID